MRKVLTLAGVAIPLLVAGWFVLGPGSEVDPARNPVLASRAEQLGLPAETPIQLRRFRSIADLDQPIAQFETVFWEPRDTQSLRRRIRETSLVRDKVVLEIGTGTGLVALCCLEAGARKVVATDVNPSAVANAAYNAEMLGQSDRFEVRWVPPERTDAYSVIGDGERFDVIISNPPWESERPSDVAERALYDEGFALQRSLLKDLDKHLTPDGRALLAYGCVEAIKSLGQLAWRYGHRARVLDDRTLDDLPPVFLPGVLIKITPLRDGDNASAEGSPALFPSTQPLPLSD